MRLIDAEALYTELHEVGGCDAERNSWADGWDKAIDEAIRLVKNAPTVDAVVVVRCKDCKRVMHSVEQGNDVYVCWRWCRGTTADGYCNKGERIDDEQLRCQRNTQNI